mmetsp:Transcript_114667/g.272760  ORF Transcript_114667/g.272760 Transcript_114667/m.272760 type:complete len:300 (-) Transcript_114667:90-989(-)
MVGGLVQKDHIWPHHEELGHADSHLPTSAEEAHFAVHVFRKKAHLFHDESQGLLELVHPEQVLLVAELLQPVHQGLHLIGVLRVRLQSLLHLLHLVHHRLLLRHSAQNLLPQGVLEVQVIHKALLQNSDLGIWRALHHLPLLRRELSQQHPQLRGLAAAIGAHQRQLLPRAHSPRGVLEDHPTPQADSHFLDAHGDLAFYFASLEEAKVHLVVCSSSALDRLFFLLLLLVIGIRRILVFPVVPISQFQPVIRVRVHLLYLPSAALIFLSSWSLSHLSDRVKGIIRLLVVAVGEKVREGL